MSEKIDNIFPLLHALAGLNRSHYENDFVHSLIENYANLLKSKEKIIPKCSIYLNSALHDSKVISIKNNKNTFSIVLNDFCSMCFCNALIEIINIKVPKRKRIFPISLSFDKYHSINLSWINRNNKLIKVNTDRYLPKLSEYLYDQLIEIQNNSISIGILFWAKSSKNKQHLLLQVKSRVLRIEEFQRNAFLELFDYNFLELFDSFWAIRRQGVLFDYNKAFEFIESRI